MALSDGGLGVSVNERSKRLAEDAAKKSCEEWNGAEDCKLLITYHNQCAAFSGPSRGGKQVAGESSVAYGPTIRVAENLATKGCQKRNGGGTCMVIHSDCTKPWFEKF
jgi:hypothetical protein